MVLGTALPLYVELGCEAVNYFTNRHWDDYYDRLTARTARPAHSTALIPAKRIEPTATPRRIIAAPILASATGSATGAQRRYKNQLPSPEPEERVYSSNNNPHQQSQQQYQQDYRYDDDNRRAADRRDNSLERESETSERVLRAYEAEQSDPPRKVDTVLPDARSGVNMSQANGYNPQYARDDGYGEAQRSRSHPPRSRYADDDSDYDEREGRRYRGGNGRGYDDDREIDREIIETERYRGPARPHDARRMDSYSNRSGYDGPYGAGAVAPYRRSQGDVTEVTRRSSRGRRDRYDRDDDRSRSRSYSDSRSRSRSRSKERGLQGELDKYFDTSTQGLGVGLAGAVAGGLAGRHFGARGQHKNRDIVIGALVGGLAVNAAENQYRDWKDKREQRKERDEGRLEAPYRGDGRARSSNR